MFHDDTLGNVLFTGTYGETVSWMGGGSRVSKVRCEGMRRKNPPALPGGDATQVGEGVGVPERAGNNVFGHRLKMGDLVAVCPVSSRCKCRFPLPRDTKAL